MTHMVVTRAAEAGRAADRRVGLCLRPDRGTAVLLADGRVDAVVGLDVPDPAALLDALGPLDDVSMVSVDLSGLLAAALQDGSARQVVMVRITPRPAVDPLLAGHPSPRVERLVAHRFTIRGGHDLYGRDLAELDLEAALTLCDRPELAAANGIAVLATGSAAQSRHERDVADLLQFAFPDTHISIAGDFGGLGLAPREATVVLDAALSGTAERLAGELRAAVGARLPDATVMVGRGDGGVTTLTALVTHPVSTLEASTALRLLAAARCADADDCRVVLTRGHPDSDPVPPPFIGEVRDGLVSVQPYLATALAADLAIPTALVAPYSASRVLRDEGTVPEPRTSGAARTGGIARTGRAAQTGQTGQTARAWAIDVDPAVDDPEVAALVTSDDDPDELAAVGAALSRPTAWVDEIAQIENREQLESIKQAARERAVAIAIANGTVPGTAEFVEVSTVAVPYSPSGTVRLRVRVAGREAGPIGTDRRAGTDRVNGS